MTKRKEMSKYVDLVSNKLVPICVAIQMAQLFSIKCMKIKEIWLVGVGGHLPLDQPLIAHECVDLPNFS